MLDVVIVTFCKRCLGNAIATYYRGLLIRGNPGCFACVLGLSWCALRGVQREQLLAVDAHNEHPDDNAMFCAYYTAARQGPVPCNYAQPPCRWAVINCSRKLRGWEHQGGGEACTPMTAPRLRARGAGLESLQPDNASLLEFMCGFRRREEGMEACYRSMWRLVVGTTVKLA